MPKVIVIAGPNGAGKSTLAPWILREAYAVHEFVNADSIAVGLSAFAPQSVAFAAGRLMLQRLHKLAAARRDFAFETTLSSRSFAPWLRQLQAERYEVHLIYLWIPQAEMAVERVMARVKEGGHHVPNEVVRRRYDKSLKNFFSLYGSFADSWIMLNNSTPSVPRAMAWRHKNGPVFSRKDGLWRQLKARYEQDPRH
jgi:predicted ABC-type ATPase